MEDWPPAEQDVPPPSAVQDAMGMGLATLWLAGALVVLFAVAVGLVALVYYFGVPRAPMPGSVGTPHAFVIPAR